jgi:hypothetical protein
VLVNKILVPGKLFFISVRKNSKCICGTYHTIKGILFTCWYVTLYLDGMTVENWIGGVSWYRNAVPAEVMNKLIV